MLATSFSVRNHAALCQLFQLLGAPFSEGSLAANAVTASELWLNEHREINAIYPDPLLIRVYEEFGLRLGLVGENLPEPKLAALPKLRTNSPGGTIRAMIKRYKLYRRLEAGGDALGTFLCWGGQRLRELKTGETLAEIIRLVETENPAILDHPWFKAELAKDDTSPDRYQRPFATETEILILCALVTFGAELQGFHAQPISEPSRTLRGPNGPVEVPGRTVLYYTLERGAGKPPIVIFNGAAVERINAKDEALEPRPTTASTALEIGKIWGFDGVQGLMVSNPHSERLALETDMVVVGLGYEPTFVIYGLPGREITSDADKVTAAKTILGEVARNLTIEQRALVIAG